MVELADLPEENSRSRRRVKYINRLSDFLFVAAATSMIRARRDVLWVPGQNR